jgi:predicted nuclease with TOPRIM domain
MTKELENKLEEEQVEKNKVETLTNEVDTLKNELEATKNELETIKTNFSELEASKNKVETENNELKEKLKREVETLANVVVNNGANGDTPSDKVDTIENFFDKYQK